MANFVIRRPSGFSTVRRIPASLPVRTIPVRVEVRTEVRAVVVAQRTIRVIRAY